MKSPFSFSRIYIWVLAGGLFSCQMSYAQVKDTSYHVLTGTVRTAEDMAPVIGATVRIKGTRKGTITNAAGEFRLLVSPTDTLLVTAVGFMQLVKPCRENKLMQLILPVDQNALNEVMVIGYGHEKKENILGSIATVSGNEITRSTAISFDDALAGQAPGVHVLSSSGVPGSATAITIRGISTLNPDGSQPLIVIDGIPVYGSGQNLNTSTFNPSTLPSMGFGGTRVSNSIQPKTQFENDPLAMLNPGDIKSIRILKDAYATAIYGSRGAAGVILVTTKRGESSKPKVNLRYIIGVAQPIGQYDLLDGPEYNKIYTEYYREKGLNKVFNSPYNTNWVDEVTRRAVTQNLNLSMSGGSDKMQYYVSGSYMDQPSYIINNGYKRYTGRVNLTYKASEKFSAGIRTSISYTNNTALNAQAIYRTAILKAPNLPIYEDNGDYAYDKGSNPIGEMDSNPVADAKENINSLENEVTLGNLFLQYKPISWITLRSELGIEFNNGRAYTRRVKRPSGFGDDAVESNTQNRRFTINNTISFLKTVGNDHYVNAVIGQSFEKSVENSVSLGGYGFFNDEIKSIAAAKNKYVSKDLKQQWALVSYFARVNYEFKNKYLAGVTYRIDGSSKFSRNKRYVGFPSFSLGWRLSNEPFLKEYGWMDDLKIRGSIGYSGNNSVFSYYGNQGQYILNDDNLQYAGIPILQMKQPENPNLKWERTRSIDVGIDGSFFRNRLTVTLDYYNRHIKDMILSSAVPLYQGWVIQPQNIGDMLNKGWELSLSADVIRNKDLWWTTRFNVSTNKNKILKLNFEGKEVGLENDAYKFLKEGASAGQFYLYDWVSVDPGTGNPLWNDGKDNISTIPPASRFREVPDVNVYRKPYGTSFPDFFGGWNNTFGYKNWELNAFVSFSIGGKMINGSRATLLSYATADAHNLSSEILQRWIIPGQETDIPRLANNSITVPSGSGGASATYDYTTSRTITRFLENATYLRLRTIRLSYNFNRDFLQKITHHAMSRLQLFIKAGNLFTWTKYSGVDPEVSAFGSSAIHSGYDELTMPQNKVYQAGINVAF